ncbi:MAG: hypothetical protein QE280_05390 [Caulobacter sp.]|nr:hypothetical protein [Caulobacter sp.]
MPLLFDDPEPDLVGLGEGLSLMPLPDSLARGEIFRDAQLTGRLGGFLRVEDAKAFDRDLQRMTGYSDAITADEANERFGVDGETLFKAPVLPVEAAWQQRQATERQFRDYVLGNSDVGPLSSIAAGVAGTLLDPVSIPLMFLPELLGVAKLGQAAFAMARGAKAGSAVVKAGRLATASRYALEGAAEGLIGGAGYEALNYGLRNYEGDDYSFGDAGRNLILGAVLGAGAKGVLGAILPPGAENRLASDPSMARAVLRGEAAPGFGPEDLRAAAAIEALPDARLPETVERLPEEQRAAATMLAVERVIDDAPVDLAPVIQRQEAANLKALDEMPGTPGTLKGRMLEAGVAVTTRGDEVPVRYALVEIEDLVTSHDDDLIVNADYPAALQPRARDRAGAVAWNRKLQSQLNPLRLLREAGEALQDPIRKACSQPSPVR